MGDEHGRRAERDGAGQRGNDAGVGVFVGRAAHHHVDGDGFGGIASGDRDGYDELYDQAVQIVITERKASTSFIQRHLQIGYNRAARIIETMEKDGLIGPANHVGKREILLDQRE